MIATVILKQRNKLLCSVRIPSQPWFTRCLKQPEHRKDDCVKANTSAPPAHVISQESRDEGRESRGEGNDGKTLGFHGHVKISKTNLEN